MLYQLILIIQKKSYFFFGIHKKSFVLNFLTTNDVTVDNKLRFIQYSSIFKKVPFSQVTCAVSGSYSKKKNQVDFIYLFNNNYCIQIDLNKNNDDNKQIEISDEWPDIWKLDHNNLIKETVKSTPNQCKIPELTFQQKEVKRLHDMRKETEEAAIQQKKLDRDIEEMIRFEQEKVEAAESKKRMDKLEVDTRYSHISNNKTENPQKKKSSTLLYKQRPFPFRFFSPNNNRTQPSTNIIIYGAGGSILFSYGTILLS